MDNLTGDGITCKTFVSCRDRGWIGYIPQAQTWHIRREGVLALEGASSAPAEDALTIIKFPGVE